MPDRYCRTLLLVAQGRHTILRVIIVSCKVVWWTGASVLCKSLVVHGSCLNNVERCSYRWWFASASKCKGMGECATVASWDQFCIVVLWVICDDLCIGFDFGSILLSDCLFPLVHNSVFTIFFASHSAGMDVSLVSKKTWTWTAPFLGKSICSTFDTLTSNKLL